METLEQQTIDSVEDPYVACEDSDNGEIDDSDDIEYPESDGEPMGETGYHVRASMHLLGALSLFFNDRKDVYVAADMFLYFEKGNPSACKAPDVMVIKNVGNHERRIFKIWEEGSGPCMIFEITSKSSMLDDLVIKSALYAKLGVREYFIFDPLDEYLEAPFIGLRLAGDEYELIPPDDQGRVYSNELEAPLERDKHLLRIIDPKTGEFVPSIDEAMQLVAKESDRADQESRRADQESRRADQESERADQESRRAEKLAAILKKMGVDPDSEDLET